MQNHLQVAEMFAKLLDDQFQVGRIRFGLSSFVDLFPGLGDGIDALLSFYLVWIALKLRVPSDKVAEMIGNIFLNFAVGTIPLFGDAIYIINKVNLKNLEIIKKYAPHPDIVEGQVVA